MDAVQNTADLERSQREADRYTAAWEQAGSIPPDAVQPATLAFAQHAATAAEGARAARLLMLERQLGAATTPLTAQA
jgi:hypothetical protein